MKRFILKILSLAFPLLVLLVTVNYYGDSATLFDNDYEKKMAKIIKAGNNVTNIANYDERLFIKNLIKGSKASEILVLGSSRNLLLSSEMLKEPSLLNNAVSSAQIEDLIAIFQLHKENKSLPKRLLLGIDPWTFNANDNKTRWKSLSDAYNRFFEVEEQQGNKWSKYKELVSLSYFQSSLKNIPRVISGENNPESTSEIYNLSNTKLKDGSLTYGKGYREASQKAIDQKAKAYLNNGIFVIENFNKIGETHWELFEALVAEMKKQNIEISFILTPYHPRVYQVVKRDYPLVLQTEKEVRSFAKKQGIKLLGSFDPEQSNMDATYFYDGMHCKEKALELILSEATW